MLTFRWWRFAYHRLLSVDRFAMNCLGLSDSHVSASAAGIYRLLSADRFAMNCLRLLDKHVRAIDAGICWLLSVNRFAMNHWDKWSQATMLLGNDNLAPQWYTRTGVLTSIFSFALTLYFETKNGAFGRQY